MYPAFLTKTVLLEPATELVKAFVKQSHEFTQSQNFMAIKFKEHFSCQIPQLCSPEITLR